MPLGLGIFGVLGLFGFRVRCPFYNPVDADLVPSQGQLLSFLQGQGSGIVHEHLSLCLFRAAGGLGFRGSLWLKA